MSIDDSYAMELARLNLQIESSYGMSVDDAEYNRLLDVRAELMEKRRKLIESHAKG